jgi:hypothetical protein
VSESLEARESRMRTENLCRHVPLLSQCRLDIIHSDVSHYK